MHKSLCLSLFVWLYLLFVVGGAAAQDQEPGMSARPWIVVQPSPEAAGLPVRIVAHDEPWNHVVQDIREYFPGRLPEQTIKVGFYGHGAFVAPTAIVPQNILFVGALGLSAGMDVMVFPQWQFPQKNPFLEIPIKIVQGLWETPPQKLHDTLKERLQSPLRQLERENRSATAYAALRLAQGIQAFHRARMTPSLAAFSNSAIVLVRLGELLEQGVIAAEEQQLVLSDDLRQDIAIRDLVMFGYPLPNGTIGPALHARVQGSLVNIIPTSCWKQLAGNFPMSGAIENIAVPWAPAHANWPRLPPRSEAVTILGAFLGGRSRAGHLAVQLSSPAAGSGAWTAQWRDAFCEWLPALRRLLEH